MAGIVMSGRGAVATGRLSGPSSGAPEDSTALNDLVACSRSRVAGKGREVLVLLQVISDMAFGHANAPPELQPQL